MLSRRGLDRSVPSEFRATQKYAPWSEYSSLHRRSWGLKLSGRLPLSPSLNQAKLSTAGAPSLLQVRVADPPSATPPGGLISTWVERGESTRERERERDRERQREALCDARFQ